MSVSFGDTSEAKGGAQETRAPSLVMAMYKSTDAMCDSSTHLPI